MNSYILTFNSKKYVVILFSLLITCMYCYGLIIYIINPYGYFNTNFVPTSVMNSKIIKEKMVENEDIGKYNGLILGTSSIMTLDLNTLNKKENLEFFNYSLFNSSSIDALAAFNHFYSKNKNIKKVFIGVDFFTYNDSNIEQEPIFNTRYLYKYTEKAYSNSKIFQIIQLHLNVDTFFIIIKNIKAYLNNTEQTRNIKQNGTLNYLAVYQQINAEKYDFNIVDKTSKVEKRFINSFLSYEERLNTLNLLTSKLDSLNIEYKIIFPTIYYKYDNNLQGISLYESFYKKLFSRYSKKIIDLRDIEVTKHKENFIDCRHIQEDKTKLIIENYL